MHFDAACDLWCYQQLGGLSLLHLHSVFPVGMKVLSHRIDSCALRANLLVCYVCLFIMFHWGVVGVMNNCM